MNSPPPPVKNHLMTPLSVNPPAAPQAAPNAYPKMKYGIGWPEKQAKTVLTPEQDKALGEGWYDTPTQLQAALVCLAAVPEQPPQALEASSSALEPEPPASSTAEVAMKLDEVLTHAAKETKHKSKK